MMRRHLAYLRYLLTHKRYVHAECRALGVPLWVALLHDWDKLLPSVWLPYARFIYEQDEMKRAQRRDAFLLAKTQHMRRNKHHWQYWEMIGDCGEVECLPIPDVYRRELLADWRGAAKSLGQPDLLGWYTECRDTMRFHPETLRWLDEQLGYSAG